MKFSNNQEEENEYLMKEETPSKNLPESLRISYRTSSPPRVKRGNITEMIQTDCSDYWRHNMPSHDPPGPRHTVRMLRMMNRVSSRPENDETIRARSFNNRTGRLSSEHLGEETKKQEARG